MREPSPGAAIGGRVVGPGDVAGFVVGVQGVATIRDLVAHDSGVGIIATTLVVMDSVVRDNRLGVRTVDLRGVDLTVMDNTNQGLEVDRRLRLTRAAITGNGGDGFLHGPNGSSSRVMLREVSATGNGGAGLFAPHATGVRLAASTFTGNDGDGTRLDLITVVRPTLVGGSTCGKSAQWDATLGQVGPPWGVCTGD
jgi:hypothetical protein